MATIFSHAIVGFTIAKLTTQPKTFARLPYIAAVCAMLPDADVLAFNFGIEYQSMWGHRGFSHSILFAVIVAVIYYLIFFRSKAQPITNSIIIFAAILSHGLIDALTNGGLGVGFAIPFSSERYFFPYNPVLVSPIGARFFSHYGWQVLQSEFIFLIVPCLGALFVKFFLVKNKIM